MKYVDLHVHTNVSDGTLTPTEVVNLAVQKKLAAIAITDHDTIYGIEEAKLATRAQRENGYELELIPGVEISAEYKKKDIHILGLFINEKDTHLQEILSNALKEREQRNQKMIDNLRADDIDITLDALLFDEPNTVITRAHFARFLIEHGYAKDNNEAFLKYLGYDTKYYVPRNYLTPKDAISLVLQAGGIPVLAHPLLYHLSLEELDVLISELKSYGLVGLETIYSTNTGFDEGIIRRYVNKYELLMTGGSDFHGSNKPRIELGSGMGNLKIPYQLVTKLKSYLNKK
ncbi:MAG TPA: PHP domain-containing protein [Lachnoclostridium phytofermentans]|uniref:PHP domain-containing protein n=1 Tax=Lachnoclostridium phytofermentans TaxID=66219 RepID=A0A3D2X613_9FIRM|nr:PHP domain-containing protein [Lachnoclostridium sp.]HCL02416.1 PHP domain-containing protein [Lachnoclostridium phytofermentans]